MFKTDTEILITILLGCLLFAILAIVIIWVIINYKRRQQKHFLEIEAMNEEFEKQLMRSQIEVQEATFSELSKELHDNIGQLLSSTKMLIGITERKLSDPPESLLIADETLAKAIHELRSLSKSLDKEWLQQFNFIDNLTNEINRINIAGELKIKFIHPSSLPLKADEQIILFRIVQEAVQNAIKHGRSNSIGITITERSFLLFITIEDDGKGFDTSLQSKGMGLRNIEHRTHLLKGTVTWKSEMDAGTTINIQLPIQS
ncbi:sensor histidine kinase [Ferruginibacter albus]|uniref:sensor histidine kinase n=1 Tax=Ferruginibacter albus TaxID=2875540 RepID=UPI001CC3AFCF|nr:ATP-binding protein [Ferruginibacter albus]UAY51550.1 hypothetical protein K9M53_13255 [Ferruginibacter albus]